MKPTKATVKRVAKQYGACIQETESGIYLDLPVGCGRVWASSLSKMIHAPYCWHGSASPKRDAYEAVIEDSRLGVTDIDPADEAELDAE